MHGNGSGKRLLGSVLAGLLWASPVQAGDIDRELSKRIETVRAQIDAAHRAIVGKINERFGIDYEALRLKYEERDSLYRQKLAIVEKIQNEQARRKETAKLESEFISPEYLRYAEARVVLENELERDHLLRARCLEAYESILEELVEHDPLLKAFFRPGEFQRSHGLLLTRMVWMLSGGEGASTKTLNTHPVFADRRRMPFLIQVSPGAFTSLASLRSLLVHELNHVLMHKDPVFADLARPSPQYENIPSRSPPDLYGFFFNLQYGGTPYYQYRLIQEYYSFKAQLLYDEMAPQDSTHRLSPAERNRIQQLMDWTYGDLSARNKEFVKRHPQPSIHAHLEERL